jgi:hypothetical protein
MGNHGEQEEGEEMPAEHAERFAEHVAEPKGSFDACRYRHSACSRH